VILEHTLYYQVALKFKPNRGLNPRILKLGITSVFGCAIMKSSVIIVFGLICLLHTGYCMKRHPGRPTCPNICNNCQPAPIKPVVDPPKPVVVPPKNPKKPIRIPPGQGSCNNCKCTTKELDGPGGLPVGNCLAKDPSNKEYFCYISPTSGCGDKKPSTRLPNLYLSYKACECERADGITAADVSYDEYDYSEYDEQESEYDQTQDESYDYDKYYEM